MNVKQLKEYLNLPDDTIVNTVASRYYGPAVEITLTTDELDYTNYTENPRITKNHSCFGTKILVIGDLYE